MKLRSGVSDIPPRVYWLNERPQSSEILAAFGPHGCLPIPQMSTQLDFWWSASAASLLYQMLTSTIAVLLFLLPDLLVAWTRSPSLPSRESIFARRRPRLCSAIRLTLARMTPKHPPSPRIQVEAVSLCQPLELVFLARTLPPAVSSRDLHSSRQSLQERRLREYVGRSLEA